MVTRPYLAYAYRAKLVRVIDGDTIEVDIDLGFHETRRERVRLLGIDCPEVVGARKAAGMAAMGYVQAWMGDGRLIIQTQKGDSFGRWLAHVWREIDGSDLVQDLLANGHGVQA